jgi:hypothetical protein
MGGLYGIFGILIGLALPGELRSQPWHGPPELRPASASRVLPIEVSWRVRLLQGLELAAAPLPGAPKRAITEPSVASPSSIQPPPSRDGPDLCSLHMSFQW